MSFLISNFLKVRKKTSELVSKLEPEDMIVQSNDFVSPIKWHLGHTSWFFENFILQKRKNYKKFDKSFNYIFNSYYNGVGIYNPKEKRGTKTAATIRGGRVGKTRGGAQGPEAGAAEGEVWGRQRRPPAKIAQSCGCRRVPAQGASGDSGRIPRCRRAVGQQ